METVSVNEWIRNVIKPEQVEKYLNKGQDFLDENLIKQTLLANQQPDKERIREIIAKSKELVRLDPDETAALLNCQDEELWQEMYGAGLQIKQNVYGRRIVTFAPLYISNYCVNSCVYCGFRTENKASRRKQLTMPELEEEIRALVAKGHKRLIMVYGEHPSSDVHYIAETLKVAYSTKEGHGEIRRANVNAAPLAVEDLEILRDVGIGTFQVFQETYHHQTYQKLHPRGLKANYLWRLYALHRAMEAGVDDVGIGALFGLYDWKFEVMGLLLHTIDLEEKFGGVGPHTISFPRMEPAINTPFAEKSPYIVNDDTFKKLVTVIRLSVPYTGMILTARESARVRNDVINVGCTQIDAGSNIGIGGYQEDSLAYDKQQFILGDNRSLDEAIRDMAKMGYITSFCTADYRCGRTGGCFMGIAKKGKIHNLCMPNAILTFKEYLLDYASDETRAAADYLINQELAALPSDQVRETVIKMLDRINQGERDLFL
ncbi:[FeFe]-hydrogenase maturation HydG, radical SAM [Syntrophomonas zehnderi OL-4]|uniref:[FeFe]-hydrogenase maturation HydG, radical SAM n=1 Tax=Syntrophomonas zehnderi OL-4 TaxID=690567 RepID=A0A0E3W3Y0_9FIRM|nr:[FeFe] hydrogenase H-cluster radical SAM maturase HydG [Syntrophomonas zehnderi]CFY11646.1 [FeFe]-hydrogenase maturation HydG, radical SAM [Syntrophomonas zehnderi OL-4]